MTDKNEELLFSEKKPYWFIICLFGALVAIYITGNCIDGGYREVFYEIRFYIILLLFCQPLFFWGTMKVELSENELAIFYGPITRKKGSIKLEEIKSVSERTIVWVKDFKFIGITY